MDYSQLQKLQEELDQKEKARKTAKPQTGKTESPQTGLPVNPQDGKPAKPHAGKPTSPQARLPIIEQVEKYTTRLEPSLVKRIKIYAAEQDVADYEVVKQAVEDYLAKKK